MLGGGWGESVPCESSETDDGPGDVLKDKGGSESGCELQSSEQLLLLFETRIYSCCCWT